MSEIQSISMLSLPEPPHGCNIWFHHGTVVTSCCLKLSSIISLYLVLSHAVSYYLVLSHTILCFFVRSNSEHYCYIKTFGDWLTHSHDELTSTLFQCCFVLELLLLLYRILSLILSLKLVHNVVLIAVCYDIPLFLCYMRWAAPRVSLKSSNLGRWTYGLNALEEEVEREDPCHPQRQPKVT